MSMPQPHRNTHRPTQRTTAYTTAAVPPPVEAATPLPSKEF